MISRDPDPGLELALKLNNIPKGGQALDLGFGSARNLLYIAKHYGGCLGYDMEQQFVQRALQRINEEASSAEVYFADATKLRPDPNTLSVVSLSIMHYLPKSFAGEYIKRIWKGIKSKGILHAEFATPDDFLYSLIKSDVHTLDPFYKDSFIHECGDPSCYIKGASFWTENESLALIANLGPYILVHEQMRIWDEFVKGRRAFFFLTVQKL